MCRPPRAYQTKSPGKLKFVIKLYNEDSQYQVKEHSIAKFPSKCDRYIFEMVLLGLSDKGQADGSKYSLSLEWVHSIHLVQTLY